jgi:hypothetical protein
MSVRFPGRASIDPSAPEAVGVCGRCGQLYSLRDLRYQPIYAGRNVLVTRLRVCDRCTDEPNPQLRTIRIPPDPWPVSDPRVENFNVDEKNFLHLQKVITHPSMFLAQSSMSASLEVSSSVSIGALFDGTSVIDAALHRGVNLSGAIDGVSALDVTLQRDVDIAASLDGVSALGAGLKRGITQAPAFEGVSAFSGILQRGQRIAADLNGATNMAAILEHVAVLSSIVQQASSTSTTSTITAPAGIIAGDLLVLMDSATSALSTPTSVIPAGFTQITQSNGTGGGAGQRQILSYKLADGSEAGASITGMTGNFLRKVLATFRGNVPATAVTPAGAAAQTTSGNPSAQIVPSGIGIGPLVVVAAYGAIQAIDPRSFTPSADGELFPAGTDDGYFKFKIYNSSPANVTVDMDDEGDVQSLTSCYIEMSG